MPLQVCPKQSFTLLNITDKPESLACRSLLLFLDNSISGVCYWPQTSTHSYIPAHQSGLRLICQQDKALSLTMGSVIEGPALWVELNQLVLSWCAGQWWRLQGEQGQNSRDQGSRGVGGGVVMVWWTETLESNLNRYYIYSCSPCSFFFLYSLLVLV